MGEQESGSGGSWLKRQLCESVCHQKMPFFHSWFRFLLLFCLVFVLCYSQSSSSRSWWENFPLHMHYQRFLNRTNQVNLPPAYRVHPKHRIKPTEIYETTASTTVLPTVPPTGTQFHHAYPRNYHFNMDNPDVCKTKTPFLVLMVPVAPKNVAARDAIRQTWGKESLVQGEAVLTLFMLGLSGGADVEQVQEKLKQENLQHHDLIQSNFMDTYLNLTTKTMVIMDWLATRCPTAAYAMKIDSDMFLNIDNLVMMLQKPGIPKLNYLTGMLMWNRPVVRSKNSKWYVPEEMYPEPQYPTYTLGMGYIFSNDLPEKFVEASKSVKPFNIEDAYIGMCMKQLGLAPTSPPNPSQFKAYNTRYNRCEFSKVITYILGSSQELLKYWTDLKKPEPLC
ncbi:beta-1,3-galactosyltransferase 1-like [Epinephelus lanceolatus]|uniref:beta-1,3-galactosyltransferase 2-like isoform X1 n=2 Tax=Epinephelus lanceolatus TaxID=310571 RepID=UPI001446BFCD|nr:beta-1,3-galactosyltransferase 2-like isoform X1 [Epinephelus lanceolatus]